MNYNVTVNWQVYNVSVERPAPLLPLLLPRRIRLLLRPPLGRPAPARLRPLRLPRPLRLLPLRPPPARPP